MFVIFVLSLVAVSLALHESDFKQARMQKPGPHLQGSSSNQIRTVLNKSLKKLFPGHHYPCSSFSYANISLIESELNEFLESELNSVYIEASDSRQLLADDPTKEAELEAKGDVEVLDVLRDSRCASVAMKIVHHISDATRKYLMKESKLIVPLLPENGLDHVEAIEEKGKVESSIFYHQKLSCETGHNSTTVEPGQWKGWPDWPDEFTYEGRGFGPFPFWYDDSPLIGDSAQIFTQYSAVRNAEKIYHDSCNLYTLGGPEETGCYDLFVGEYGYVYTPDESFCCYDSRPDKACWLNKPQRNFWETFDYQGISYDYDSMWPGHYQGPVHNYTLLVEDILVGPFWFWYYTDLDGMPVEQGEGECIVPRQCMDIYNNDLPLRFIKKYVYHEFDRESINITSFDESTFKVPDVCLETTIDCTTGHFPYCAH